MEKKNTLLLTVIAVATLLVAVVGATFAYFGSFAPDNTSNTPVNVTTPKAQTSTFVSTGAQLLLDVPAGNMTFAQRGEEGVTSTSSGTLKVALTSGTADQTMKCTYDVYFQAEGTPVYGLGDTTKTEGADKEITMKITATEGITVDKFATETNFDANTGYGWTNLAGEGKPTIKIATADISNSSDKVPTEQTFTFEAKVYNLTQQQDQISGKSFKGYFYAVLDASRCAVAK